VHPEHSGRHICRIQNPTLFKVQRTEILVITRLYVGALHLFGKFVMHPNKFTFLG
jgi:hypothetical protein